MTLAMTCAKCGFEGDDWNRLIGGQHCLISRECALRAELRDVRAERDALRDLRAAVLEIAELAQTTEGEDTGKFLAYRLRAAAKA